MYIKYKIIYNLKKKKFNYRHPTWEAEVFIAERRLSCTAEDCLCPFEDNREHNQDV